DALSGQSASWHHDHVASLIRTEPTTEACQMSSNSSMSGISLLMAMSAVLASTPADAAYKGAEVLPGGRDVVVGGVRWGAGVSDPAVPHTRYIERIGGGDRRVFRQFTGRIVDFKAAPIGGLLAVNEVV